MKILFFIFMVSTITNLVRSQFHCGNGNYTRNSTYNANLNTLLSSLPSKIPESGFYNASEGVVPNIVYVMLLCRGDLQVEACRTCADIVAIDVLLYCPYEKQAYLWNEFCMLRFSDKAIVRGLVVSPRWQAGNWENATSVRKFKDDVKRLLYKLGGEAAAGGAVKKVAVGNVMGPDSQAIYGLVQCTPDITPMECSSCLGQAITDLRVCCDWMRGATIFRPSCSIRYNGALFFNETMFQHQQPPPPPPSPFTLTPREKDGNNSRSTIITVVVPICACVTVAVAAGICMFLRLRKGRRSMFIRLRKGRRKQQNNAEFEISGVDALQYDFDAIRGATNDFSVANKLGQGGFGVVYKGKLEDGQEIAVKKQLSGISEQSDIDFKNEVLIVARLQHRNLVNLLGFCINSTQRILVYEFLQNSSLDHFIFDSTRRQMLDWKTRHNIITGIARGLLYLHQDSCLKIIHRDLKASNILLDGDMNAKLADFGLARLFVHDRTHESASKIAGTYGYMAPEYILCGHFSVKSDVFGFGVLVMEIVSGKKNNFRNQNGDVEHLISNAWRNWESGNADTVIDLGMRNSSEQSIDMMMRCIHISLLCVQEDPVERPTMAWVLQQLSSSVPITSPPFKPGFFLQGRSEATMATDNHTSAVSRNFVSITDMYPR